MYTCVGRNREAGAAVLHCSAPREFSLRREIAMLEGANDSGKVEVFFAV